MHHEHAQSRLQEGHLEEGRQPLLSGKLHQSWISDVQLLPRAQSSPPTPLLLTASNDCALSAWDLSQSADGNPRQQCTSDIDSGEPCSQMVCEIRNRMACTCTLRYIMGGALLQPG